MQKGGITQAPHGQLGARRNLAEGRLPRVKKTDAAVAMPVRLTFQDWLQTNGQMDAILEANDAVEVGRILHEGEIQKCWADCTTPEEITLTGLKPISGNFCTDLFRLSVCRIV